MVSADPDNPVVSQTRNASIKDGSLHGWFSWFARESARVAGSPGMFLLALMTVVVWAVTGPLFGFSDTWQLVINTGTTIVTFLMVFLIQNSQNRDALAVQIKLSELIIAMRGAKNRIAVAEEMSDEDLERLHEDYRSRANSALETLQRRRELRGTDERRDAEEQVGQERT